MERREAESVSKIGVDVEEAFRKGTAISRW